MKLWLRWALYVLVAYLLLSASYGFVVGRDIARSKNNPFAALGENIVGRDAVERTVISLRGVPAWITASPTFWLVLRIAE